MDNNIAISNRLFDTEEKQASAVLYFRALLQDPGWLLLVTVVNGKMEEIRKELEEGVPDETPADVQNRRNLLKAHKWFTDFPQKMLDDLTNKHVDIEPTVDPYHTKATLLKERQGT